jgi:hypothetical protein
VVVLVVVVVVGTFCMGGGGRMGDVEHKAAMVGARSGEVLDVGWVGERGDDGVVDFGWDDGSLSTSAADIVVGEVVSEEGAGDPDCCAVIVLEEELESEVTAPLIPPFTVATKASVKSWRRLRVSWGVE